ncbi:MAG: membrane integrity-associated transporter subunit PqiC [Gammaproteobacteria bacterium]|nr:membrane integrity-associated transporter subunit PqiC [Gammaproteobacteria bacterium]MBQ0838510.1 membrane integrity-associated transporter subunit PqiC [Gammaproteobacteria bacterium]
MKSLLLLATLFVAGCTSSVPTLNKYLLRSDAAPQFAGEPATAVVGLGTLTVASYIDGLGLVLETDEGKIREARDNQWAEPLRESLRSYLAQEIAAQAKQVIRARSSGEIDGQRRIDIRIDIRIDELHGTASGEARLVAYWTVFDTTERKITVESGLVESERLSADGYPALVAAEKVLLRRLAAAIAAKL